jgi:hypothetical protein
MPWYWISTTKATFGVGVRDGRVEGAAPIAAWTIGKKWSWVRGYYKSRGARIKMLKVEEDD